VALPFCGDAQWLAVEHHLSLAEQTNVIDAAGLAALRRHCVALRGWKDRARQACSAVCHGDLHPQNVLMSGDQVVIIDWDAICVGPPAWDHAALLPWAERWGGSPQWYADFARGYGADLRASPLATELATLRLLAATLNKITGAASDPAYAAEARIRIRYWLGDPAAPTWTPALTERRRVGIAAIAVRQARVPQQALASQRLLYSSGPSLLRGDLFLPSPNEIRQDVVGQRTIRREADRPLR